MIYFFANSVWYLENFRTSTIEAFHNKYKVFHCAPSETDQGELRKYSTYLSFYANPSSINIAKELYALITIWFRLLRNRPEVVFSFNPKINLYLLICCKLLRIPCVPNVSGVGVASELRGPAGFFYKLALSSFFKSANHVFFQNLEDMKKFKREGILGKASYEVLPGSGVDLNIFYPTKAPKGRRNFLMASRLIKQKGVVEYLICAKNIALTNMSVKLFLAGVEDNSARSVSLSDIKSFCNNDNVRYLGRSDDMPSLLTNIDIVVLPSYYPEGTPRSLLEAAAAGKVIITTDTPGCRDVVIEGVNGFLVPPRDTQALKEAMEKVINLSDERLAEMQASSRKLAEEKFDEQYVIQRYLDVAEEILAKKRT